jgi:hypothetical protein
LLSQKEALDLQDISQEELHEITEFLKNFITVWKDKGEPPNHKWNVKDGGSISYAKVTIETPKKYEYLESSFRSYSLARKLNPEHFNINVPSEESIEKYDNVYKARDRERHECDYEEYYNEIDTCPDPEAITTYY